ncbi:hypothetical protein FE257_005546 [Aspergillus nanangensis]|uniref:Uncharacterized protein n=1 Tax=Aspergillus nanangensis TaxID=2582783 RepID=A0AAD4GVH8_ASPNN|nr:hypothetical protein FE257_005546 [Aspergillus nanangensis]
MLKATFSRANTRPRRVQAYPDSGHPKPFGALQRPSKKSARLLVTQGVRLSSCDETSHMQNTDRGSTGSGAGA